MADHMIQCPECGAWPHVKCENCPTCKGCLRTPDRRKPTANDRAVERILKIDRKRDSLKDGAHLSQAQRMLNLIVDIINEEAAHD